MSMHICISYAMKYSKQIVYVANVGQHFIKKKT
jgi:hypothetical protein